MAPPRTNVSGRDARARLVRRRHHETDLFDLFPDLPRPWRPTYADQVRHMQDTIALMRQRVRQNAVQHRAAAAAITEKYRRRRKRS